MKKTTALFVIILLLAGCQDVLLGENPPNSPQKNFEMLWHDFDRHYSLFYIKKTNWDSLYEVYRPQINDQTNNAQLWKITTSMLEVLNDSHTVLYDRDDWRNFSSGYALNEIAIKKEFSLGVIQSKYTGPLTRIESEEDLQYGRIKNKDIGYVFLRKTMGDKPEEAMAEVFAQLGDFKAIILDLRTNAGGFAFYSRIVAGAFSDGEHVVGTVQLRNGPEHNDFSGKTLEVTTKTGTKQFVKPVIVLTDRGTISGGEYLTLHMKSFAHVTHIGDTTAGDFGAAGMRRFLPNGWSYTYSIKMFLLADGTSLDGVGIAPDVWVKNTQADTYTGTDRVLERAIQYLFERYGIQ